MNFKKLKNLSIINFVLLFVLVLSLAVNQVVITKTSRALGIKNNSFNILTKGFQAGSGDFSFTGDLTQDAVKLVISQGAPEIYGAELGVSFDQVVSSMNIMRQFDPDYGGKKIILTGDDLQRYIDVALKISCEYCCGAEAIIFKNGEAACGCAHSIAMRGLLAYLIQNHGDKYTNDQLLRELARWKAMYYPKQMIKKMAQGLQTGNYSPDIASLVLDIKLPDYGGGSQSPPLPSEIENLPSMVGGC